MDETELRELEREFHAAVYPTSQEGTERDYQATRFRQMVDEMGARQTAKQLLADSRPQQGLYKLWELGLLQSSLEATVLQERFGPLFTEAELAEARRRLNQLRCEPDRHGGL